MVVSQYEPPAPQVTVVGGCPAGFGELSGMRDRCPPPASVKPGGLSAQSDLRVDDLTSMAYFEGEVRTSGLSILLIRSISLIHYLGFSTRATLRPCFEFGSNSGLKPTWMWSS